MVEGKDLIHNPEKQAICMKERDVVSRRCCCCGRKDDGRDAEGNVERCTMIMYVETIPYAM